MKEGKKGRKEERRKGEGKERKEKKRKGKEKKLTNQEMVII